MTGAFIKKREGYLDTETQGTGSRDGGGKDWSDASVTKDHQGLQGIHRS